MRYVRKIDGALAKVESWLLVIFLGLMVSLTFFHVCLRMISIHVQTEWTNFLLIHLDWSQPLVRLLVLWTTFVGASLVTRDDRHIRIDIVPTVLHSGNKRLWQICISGFSCLISLYLARASIAYVMSEVSYGDVVFLGIPAWFAHLIVPIGFLTMAFRFFLHFALCIYGNDQGNRADKSFTIGPEAAGKR